MHAYNSFAHRIATLNGSIISTDAYAVPANFLEIDVVNPMTTITAGKKRYTDYEVRMRVSGIDSWIMISFVHIVFGAAEDLSRNYYFHCAAHCQNENLLPTVCALDVVELCVTNHMPTR